MSQQRNQKTTNAPRASQHGEAAEVTRLEDRPRTELYALAQRLEIAGCADMSKPELIEAIRRR